MIREATLSKEELKALKIVPGATRFRESALAHKYLDGLQGIELGASSHNGFNLAGSINVAPVDDDGGRDSNFYRNQQIMMCGSYAVVDVDAEADKLPFEDSSQDYVISSHVIEHVPNPIGAFLEWTRILKDGGIVFMIFPKKGALPSDASRELTPRHLFWQALGQEWDADTALKNIPDTPGGRRGHYWTFTLASMLDLIESCKEGGLNWEILEALETDDKVFNGHCVVVRVHKEIQPRDLEEGETLQEATELIEKLAEAGVEVADVDVSEQTAKDIVLENIRQHSPGLIERAENASYDIESEQIVQPKKRGRKPKAKS